MKIEYNGMCLFPYSPFDSNHILAGLGKKIAGQGEASDKQINGLHPYILPVIFHSRANFPFELLTSVIGDRNRKPETSITQILADWNVATSNQF